jgi:simple sugar transport system ATP-binding protein
MDGGGRDAPAAIPVAVRGVTKRFPGVLANDDVSFAIHAGEVHVLLGENGAGKSTLIGLLAGMQQPDSGTILIDGKPVRIGSPRHALRLGIGTVFQHNMLVPTLTVAENLLLGGAWWRRPRRRALDARLRETGAAFGIAVDPDAVVGGLSLGEQQQIEIVRALWRGGRVIVLDEPTAMLTPRGIEELGGMMRRLARGGIGVVFITHKLMEALDYGDRVTVLRLGRVVGEMTPDETRGLDRAAATRRIVDMMFGAGEPRAAATVAARETAAPSPDAASPPRVDALLEVEGLRLADVRDVSFSVAAGEILAIAGIDGNGQKPLAEAIAGQRPAAGRVRLGGRDLSRLGVGGRRRAGLRYVTDDRLGEGIAASMPVSLNLLLKQIGEAPFWRRGVIRPAAIAAHARALMRLFDIRAPSVATPIGRLSGGNIQKAVLARELTGGARAVIYSKPTHGLDVRNIAAARARIRDEARAGVATLLISTDLEEVLEIAHRIAVMTRGRLAGIVANGPGAREAVGRLLVGAANAD